MASDSEPKNFFEGLLEAPSEGTFLGAKTSAGVEVD